MILPDKILINRVNANDYRESFDFLYFFRGFHTSFYVERLSGDRNYVFRLRVYESKDAAHTKFVNGLWLCAAEKNVVTKGKEVFIP